MRPEEKLAKINVCCSIAMIRAMGMQAENAIRIQRCEALAFDDNDFEINIAELRKEIAALESAGKEGGV